MVRNTRRQRGTAAVIALALLASLAPVLAAAGPASAAPSVMVRVTLERIRALSSAEEGLCGSPDWYAKVWINGVEHNNYDTPQQDDNEGNADLSPPGGWEFSESVDVATLATPGDIPISIEVWDEDGGLCFGDEHYDASPDGNKAIAGFVRISPCVVAVSGNNLPCDSANTLAGTDSDRAEVRFRVQVEEPPSTTGLNIRCTHSPLWPDPGEAVTVRAEALDGALSPRIVEQLDIWVQPDTANTVTRSRPVSTPGVSQVTHVFTPPAGQSDFAYGCRAKRDADAVFSGYRTATVGNPGGDVVPVIYTGPRASRIDIVFIADRDSYNAVDNNQFLTDAATVVSTSYYGFKEFLAGQDKFNFWIAQRQGRADDSNDGSCDHDLPSEWDDDFAFADAGAILHRKNQRDCALRGDRIFSGIVDPNVRGDALQVVTHETGHQPFGLADEYCCDGGYFQQDVAPNIYTEIADCRDDLGELLRVGLPCREWHETIDGWFDPDYYTSEPGDVTAGVVNDDLMNDNGPAQAADIRRFNLTFGACARAGC